MYLREIKAGNQNKKRGEEDRLNVISAQLYMGVEDTLMGVHHFILTRVPDSTKRRFYYNRRVLTYSQLAASISLFSTISWSLNISHSSWHSTSRNDCSSEDSFGSYLVGNGNGHVAFE